MPWERRRDDDIRAGSELVSVSLSVESVPAELSFGLSSANKAGAVNSVTSLRNIRSESSKSQSGLMRGNRRRIFWIRSKLGLFLPDNKCEMLEGCVSSSSASRLEVNPSVCMRRSNFSRIKRIFHKYNHFSFVTSRIKYICEYKMHGFSVYKC